MGTPVGIPKMTLGILVETLEESRVGTFGNPVAIPVLYLWKPMRYSVVTPGDLWLLVRNELRQKSLQTYTRVAHAQIVDIVNVYKPLEKFN